MKCYSLVIEPRLVKEIDALIKKRGMYSSRSDFIRDAIRQRLIEVKKLLGEKGEEKGSEEEDEGKLSAKEEREQEKLIEEAMDEFKYRGVH